MTQVFVYDQGFLPPAPALLLAVSSPVSPYPPATVKALVDTGADITALPASLADELGLRQVSWVLASGVTAAEARLPVFSAKIVIGDFWSQLVLVVGWDQDYALLGRDILNLWRVTLDGPNQALEIS